MKIEPAHNTANGILMMYDQYSKPITQIGNRISWINMKMTMKLQGSRFICLPIKVPDIQSMNLATDIKMLILDHHQLSAFRTYTCLY